jgi:hypothetical protein
VDGQTTIGADSLRPARLKEDTHHYFDWTKGEPFTTDPEWEGKLVEGYQNRVCVNGKEVLWATRFITGPNGWVDHFKLRADGSRQSTEILDRQTGKVYTDLECPIVWQQRTEVNGHIVDRYEERPAIERTYGSVTYEVVPGRTELPSVQDSGIPGGGAG